MSNIDLAVSHAEQIVEDGSAAIAMVSAGLSGPSAIELLAERLRTIISEAEMILALPT